jgi:branched-subunit amino acid ABC-type transport system permease component
LNEILLTLVLALGSGSLYAALAQGIVLAYRGAGVINLAHGAMALYIAYTFAGMRRGDGIMLPPFPFLPDFIGLGGPVGTVPAFLLSMVVAILLGLLLHVAVFRWLRAVPPLAKTVAASGVMLVLQAAVVIRFGTTGMLVPSVLPTGSIPVGDLVIPVNRLYFLGIVVATAIGLTLLFKYTRLGLATRGASENERGAILLGLSPDRLAASNWVLSSLVAGAAGIILASFTGLDPTTLVLLVIPAIAAALLARFESFIVATVVGMLIAWAHGLTGLLQTRADWFPDRGADAIPLLAIIVAMIISGRNLPERGSLLQARLPRSPEPRHVGRGVVVMSVLTALGLLYLPYDMRSGIVFSLIGVVLALSMVLIAGYAGQISLMQMTLAAVAALAMTRLAGDWGIPFPFGGILAVAVATLVGVILGLPALRVRGVQLAVLTLAAAFAFEKVILGDNNIVRTQDAANIPPPSVLGLKFGINDSFPFITTGTPNVGFGLFLLAVAVACVLGVAHLRKSDLGRKFIAVRSNERAAASLGVDVARTKLIAFGISSMLAGIAGVLFAYDFQGVTKENYLALMSIQVLAIAYVGGIGTLTGATLAGMSIAGGFFPKLVERLFELGDLQPYILGVMTLMVIVLHPEGFDSVIKHAGHGIQRLFVRLFSSARGERPGPGSPSGVVAAETEAVQKETV